MEERKWRANEENLEAYEQALTSWTDDVPTCRESGLGSCINELYRRDGSRLQLHPSEDRSFRFRIEEYDLCLYGIFDGFQGCQVADFAKKRLPAEILLGQLVPGTPDENVKEIMKQAFICVDKEYFVSIGDKLAARMVMRSDEEFSQSSQLAELDEKVSCGSSAILALTLGDRLYVASAGDSRAVLLRGGEVVPLWIEHTTTNEDELLRLTHLGLKIDGDNEGAACLGELRYTRCLGNYLVKGGYKESNRLTSCRDEPVIPEPEVQGGIPIHDLTFLLLYTKSLWLAVAECSGSRDPDAEIVEMCRQRFREETSLSGVAQAVVDQVVRQHHARIETAGDKGGVREDITLLIREFGRTQEPRPERRDDKTLTRSSIRAARPTRSSTTTESSSLYLAGKELPVDANGRIPPYVDFGPFYKLWNHQRRDSTSTDL